MHADAIEVARIVEQRGAPPVGRERVFVEHGYAGVVEEESPLVCDAQVQQVSEERLQRPAVGQRPRFFSFPWR